MLVRNELQSNFQMGRLNELDISLKHPTQVFTLPISTFISQLGIAKVYKIGGLKTSYSKQLQRYLESSNRIQNRIFQETFERPLSLDTNQSTAMQGQELLILVPWINFLKTFVEHSCQPCLHEGTIQDLKSMAVDFNRLRQTIVKLRNI